MINYLGVLFALLACACWGLSMICPVLAPEFSAVEITLGRYFFYGVISLGLWGRYLVKHQKIHSWPIWRKALIFAITGNVVYYGLEVMGVKLIGPSMVALLFAINPILVSLYGNLKGKEIPYSLITLPISLVAVGIIFVHANDLRVDPDISMERFWVGLLFTVSSIAMWAWYAVHNAQYLKSQKDLSFNEFNMVIGVWCLLLTLISMGAMAVWPLEQFHLTSPNLTSPQLAWFLIAASLLGLFASFMGTFFWHRASRMLPVTLAGQILVAETCFGLLYTYIHQQRLPRLYEWAGFVLVVTGVLISMRRIQQHQIKRIPA